MEPGSPPLQHTPLHDLHVRRGAKLVPFAGWEMPLHYPPGLLREHLHTREAAGLFDVSHMGQIEVAPRSGDLAEAARALETLIPTDVLGLAPGRQRYGFFTNHDGGILDDLMVANLGEFLLVVVNAANKAADLAWLEDGLSGTCAVAPLQRALLALQGPRAASVLGDLAPEAAEMRFMDARAVHLLGARCFVTRSGYTGEDGFEISVPQDAAEALAEALLADARVMPVGLGARDSLRLEAGLSLHGADIDATTTPVEAALTWAIPKLRRHGGARAGGFPGAERILRKLDEAALILPRETGEGDHAQHGGGGGRRSDAGVGSSEASTSGRYEARQPPPPPSAVPLPRCTGEDARRRVGLRPGSRTPVRAGAPLFADEADTNPIGSVTSGGFGPSVGAPVAMGYVPARLATPGTRLFAEVRGQRLPVAVAKLPFVPAGFKRS